METSFLNEMKNIFDTIGNIDLNDENIEISEFEKQQKLFVEILKFVDVHLRETLLSHANLATCLRDLIIEFNNTVNINNNTKQYIKYYMKEFFNEDIN
jgi:hypothetical protein